VETPVGDRHVLAAMEEHDLVLGGEQSGHVIFAEHAVTGDGPLAGILLLDAAIRAGARLSELAAVVTKFPQVLRNVTVREKAPFEQFNHLTAQLRQAESLLSGRGRVMLRYSGTEPKARLLLEGPDVDELNSLADAIVEELAKSLGK